MSVLVWEVSATQWQSPRPADHRTLTCSRRKRTTIHTRASIQLQSPGAVNGVRGRDARGAGASGALVSRGGQTVLSERGGGEALQACTHRSLWHYHMHRP